jgi:hypothetical protein
LSPSLPTRGKALEIDVDWSSDEVFADKGQTVITDQISPPPTATVSGSSPTAAPQGSIPSRSGRCVELNA